MHAHWPFGFSLQVSRAPSTFPNGTCPSSNCPNSISAFLPPRAPSAGHPFLLACIAKVDFVGPHDGNVKEVLSRGLAARFGGSSRDFSVANLHASTMVVFFPNWVARESAIGRSPFRFDDFVFRFSNWLEPWELARGHLQYKAWIRLHHWPILCWNKEDVKAAVSGFGELWDIDPLSDKRVDVSFFRVLIRCQHVRCIPESLFLMVEDRRFSIPIEIESWEEANPILLGEDLDGRLGLVTADAQESFTRQAGFHSIPTMEPLGRPLRSQESFHFGDLRRLQDDSVSFVGDNRSRAAALDNGRRRAFNFEFVEFPPTPALPRPRSDRTPLILSAYTFVPTSRLFRFESFWLRYASLQEVVSNAWHSARPSSEPVTRFALKIDKVQSALRTWSLGLNSALKKQASICLHWIEWLDIAEEKRVLSPLEITLRPQLKRRYEDLCFLDELKWKQRSRVQWLRARDANTKFFHLRASCRRSKNFILHLSDGNDLLTAHVSIANHLFSFFQNQLGVDKLSGTSIDFSTIFHDDFVDLSSLHSPFTMDEVKKVVFSCAPEKAPGPDGLPMLFYQHFLSVLKDDVFDVFNGLYCGDPDLRDINTGWICPILKKANAISARDLCPISLVHSLSKIISKVLAARLQLFMNQLVNPYQAAFIKGRHILDNFYCAHILIHHLHFSKQPAALLKIDFERAFDHINWKFLLELLQARGFGDKWIGWISCLLNSSSTAVLLNGTPGLSFPYKWGLRQGDPLSPLLFVLCIDVLFRLLQRAVSSLSLPAVGIGKIKLHSLQFADDVRLFFDGSSRSADIIRIILEAFAGSSGLKINFNKSSIIPIHLPSQQVSNLAISFSCPEQSFPISYLCPPLSPKSLCKVNYLPKIDNRLAGWKGSTLSRGGRLVLLNSVLSSIPTYFCLAFLLPAWATVAIDKHVCRPKRTGGIGIRNLRVSNSALLMMGLWKYYNFQSLPWVQLLKQKHYKRRPAAIATSKPIGSCPIWKGMLKLAALSLLQSTSLLEMEKKLTSGMPDGRGLGLAQPVSFSLRCVTSQETHGP
uniref:Reverse transcriptase domain-containing protein n=1 Tax=Ananas comosus var. bracteatus TaxID=296719 RepID=A0A6V7PKZ8_ANACO|nr:unnamed protein product [Ananas comosus var. bracteatus]